MPADGNSPLRQVLAAPGGDAGPLACSAAANSKVLAGFLAGEVRGGGPFPGTPSRETQGWIVCSEPAGDYGNLAAAVGALPRPPLAGAAGNSFTIILTILWNSCG